MAKYDLVLKSMDFFFDYNYLVNDELSLVKYTVISVCMHNSISGYI